MTVLFMLGLMALALALLSIEAFPVDVVALGMIVALILSGILTPSEAFAGFSNEAIIVLAGIFVLAAGLRRSGAVDAIAVWFQRNTAGRGGATPLFATVASVSAFINNTTTTALFLPTGLGLARRLGTSPSRILMPLAFASILGGSITVIGTSTNVILSGLLPQYGERPLDFFELAPVALPIAVLGLAYLLVAGRLLPERGTREIEGRYSLRDYITEVSVPEGSLLVGKTLAEADLHRNWELNVVTIVRGDRRTAAHRDDRIGVGDILVVEASADRLARLGEARGVLEARHPVTGETLRPGSTRIAEILVLPRASVIGRSLRETGFRQSHGANVIALCRHGELLDENLAEVRLRVGDVLLAQTDSESREHLLGQPGLLLLSDREGHEPRGRRWLPALIFVGALAAATFGLVGLGGAVLLGCLLMLASRSLTPQEAYLAIEWRLLILISGMLAYGEAMNKTGVAALVAEQVLSALDGGSPRMVLLAFYLLTLLLTQPMSNQAAVLLVLPIAMSAAAASGLNPRAMAVTVALAASSSFLTPLEPSSLLVYGPGGYRFSDYFRLGLGLTTLALVLTVVLVPILWPL